MNTENKISRREALGGLGATVLTIGATQAFADDPPSSVNAHPVPLENPVSKYPKPPFESQFQPWSGLASKMNPPPDHGEKSYRGSGRLAGRKALITGGRFRNGTRRSHCLCTRRSGCCDQLLSHGRTG